VPHFEWSISFGNVITTISFLAAAFSAWKDLSWRVKNLEEWKRDHQDTAETAMQNLAELKEAVVGIKTIAEGQERRIQMIEDRNIRHERS